MFRLFLTFILSSTVANLKGHQSPLFGAAGIILAFAFEFLFAFYFATHRPGDETALDTWSAILGSTAAVGVVSAFSLTLPTRDPRSEAKTSNFPYGAAAGCLFFLAVLSALMWWSLIMDHTKSSNNLDGRNVFSFGAILLASSGFAFLHFHKRQTALSGSTLLQIDKRPPVLLLRSFQADAKRVQQNKFFLQDFIGKSFEETIASDLQSFGPMVAIGDPNDYLPAPGASRLYLKDDAWKPAVTDLIERSSIVVILEGETEGLGWELNQVRKLCQPFQVFILIPFGNFRPQASATFRNMLNKAGFSITSRSFKPGSIVSFDEEYREIILATGISKSRSYGKSLRTSIGASIEKINSLSLAKRVILESRDDVVHESNMVRSMDSLGSHDTNKTSNPKPTRNLEIVLCPNCQLSVIRNSEGSCPSCGAR